MRLLILLLTIGIVAGCNESSFNQRLSTIDSLIEKDMVDSACNEISRLEPFHITDERDAAYYSLLKTQILFMRHEVTENDSLINKSIAYYEKTNNKELLSRSLYIKGRLTYKRGNIKEGVLCLKEAEHYAEDIDNNLLKSRIQDNLAIYCLNGGETSNALNYGKKALKYARLSNDKEQLLYCLENLSVYYGRLENHDSALHYIEECLPLIKYIPLDSRNIVFLNIASIYEDIDIIKAKEMAEQSINIKPTASAYRLMAHIYVMENNGEEAEKSWNKALEICENLHTEINILNDMSEYQLSIGNHREASRLASKVIILSDSLQRIWERDSVKAVMAAYDANKDIVTAKDMANKAWIFLALLITGTVALITFVIWKKKKIRGIISSQQKKLEDATSTMEKQNQKIERMETREQGQKKEIIKLRSDICRQQDEQTKLTICQKKRTEEQLSLGYKRYEEIRKGGNMKTWSKDDSEAFALFYKTTHTRFASNLSDKYGKLSLNQTLYLILSDMNLPEKGKQDVMCLTSGAFYTMKSRLRSCTCKKSERVKRQGVS